MQNRTQCTPSTRPTPSTSTTPGSASRSDAGPSRDRGSGYSPDRTLHLPGSAFDPAFLEKLRLLVRLHEEAGDETLTREEALTSGPLAVEEVKTKGGTRHAVVRRDEPLSEGGKAAAVFRHRADALRAAAVLPAAAAPCSYRLKDKPKRLGYPLHDHDRHVGHLGHLSAERRELVLTHLHLARHLAADPVSLALLLEAVGPEALPVLGRALARRIEALLP